MKEEELTFKPHSVETQDGYILTLLHVTSTKKGDASEQSYGAVLL